METSKTFALQVSGTGYKGGLSGNGTDNLGLFDAIILNTPIDGIITDPHFVLNNRNICYRKGSDNLNCTLYTTLSFVISSVPIQLKNNNKMYITLGDSTMELSTTTLNVPVTINSYIILPGDGCPTIKIFIRSNDRIYVDIKSVNLTGIGFSVNLL